MEEVNMNFELLDIFCPAYVQKTSVGNRLYIQLNPDI